MIGVFTSKKLSSWHDILHDWCAIFLQYFLQIHLRKNMNKNPKNLLHFVIAHQNISTRRIFSHITKPLSAEIFLNRVNIVERRALYPLLVLTLITIFKRNSSREKKKYATKIFRSLEAPSHSKGKKVLGVLVYCCYILVFSR